MPAIAPLDASDITIYQSCPRRWLLDQSWRVLRWRAKVLFDSCLRQAIFAISSGAAAESVEQAARTRFLTQAANPGLDVAEGSDPWRIAQDYCAMLSTITTALSRRTLLTLRAPDPVRLRTTAGEVSWQPRAWPDESGVLHRWIAVDAFDDGVLARECHGWQVFGDMAVVEAPLTLHVVEIGQQRAGRRHSPWARAWRHPVIAGRYKFQRNDGKGGHRALSGDQWRPLWYADQPEPDPVAWVDVMDAEGVTEGLLHHIAIAQPSEESASRSREQIGQVARQMELAREGHPGPAGGMELPMARGACDGWVICPWQQACYREQPEAGIAELGLYQIRGAGASGHSLRPRQPQTANA